MANAAPNLSGSASGSLDLATLLEQNLAPDDLAAIAPSVRSALGAGLSFVADATPAVSLMSTLASGGTPDPQAVVGALSATVAVVNPLAGAAVFAAGELVNGIESATEGLFRGLGLISDAHKPIQYVGLIAKGQPIPAGPTSPKWMPWESFAKGYLRSSNGIPSEYVWQHVTNNAAPTDASSAMMGNLLYAMCRDGETAFMSGPIAKNDFEKFFFALLKKDVEYWANGNPYVPPRTLLPAAVSAWNATHPPTSTVSYQAPAGSFTTDVVPFILSASGDQDGNGKEMTLPPVNLGVAPTPASKANVAGGAAAAAAGAAAAVIAIQKARAVNLVTAARPAAASGSEGSWGVIVSVALVAGVLWALKRKR